MSSKVTKMYIKTVLGLAEYARSRALSCRGGGMVLEWFVFDCDAVVLVVDDD